MPSDVADKLSLMSQESNMSGILDRLESCADDRISQGALSRGGNDGVAGARHNQGRYVDPPEPIADVEANRPIAA